MKLPPGQVLKRASVKFNTQGTSSQSLCDSRKKSVGKTAAKQGSLGNLGEAAIS